VFFARAVHFTPTTHISFIMPQKGRFSRPVAPDKPGTYLHRFLLGFLQKDYTDDQGGIDAGLRQAWSLGYTGYGVTIGIVDSGVDGSNYDIAPGYRADLSKNFSGKEILANAPRGLNPSRITMGRL